MPKTPLSPIAISTLALLVATPALAQQDRISAPSPSVSTDEEDEGGAGQSVIDESGDIVVTASRPFGSVETDIAAIDQLDADDINSYGAGSVEELIDALGPQIGSGRGRGGGRPVILLNGRPVSSFREVFGLPPEAIRNVEIFPEELALKYGYRPDQRVVNLILVPGYASAELELEAGGPTAGGRTAHEVEFGFTTIGEKSRFNAEMEYGGEGAITYAERNLAGVGGNDSNVRTLTPATQRLEAQASYSRHLDEETDLSLTAAYSVEDRESNLGLQSFSLDSGAGGSIDRFVPGTGGLRRDVSTETLEASAGLNGQIGDWRWRTTGDIGKTNSVTRTERGVDGDLVQAAVDAGAFDPVAGDIAARFSSQPTNRASSDTLTASALASLAGSVADLPAGPVQITLTTGGGYNRIESDTRIDDIANRSNLSRTNYYGRANIDLPIADDGTGLGRAVGEFSVNLNGGYEKLSDFGSLVSYGGGFNWDIADNLDFSASFIGEEAAPSLSDLGAAVVVTPNTEVYDFTRGETVLVDFVTGGNPDLSKERRRDIKLTATWRPAFLEELNVTGEYLRNRSYDVTSGFPTLTPALEAAFPGRVTRDATGRLIALDARPITYAETRNDALKLTLAYSARIGGEENARGRGEGARGRERGGGFPLPGMGRDRNGGRLRLSLGYRYQLTDEIKIAEGLPTLDLLNGDATGNSGGTPRHTVELESNLYLNGWGLRLSGNFSSATRVDGSDLTNSSDLFFGELATLDARLFFDLDDLGLGEKVPLFKDSRVSFSVDNVFDTYREVRNADGDIPFRYDRAFLDPVGRAFEIDFRKRF